MVKSIKCEPYTYEIPGGFYTNTKFLWACPICGLKWFSRTVAEQCENRNHVKQFKLKNDRFITKSMGCIEIIDQPKLDRIIPLLLKIKSTDSKRVNEIFKLNKDSWKISYSEVKLIIEALK